jgi:hypothetical protein
MGGNVNRTLTTVTSGAVTSVYARGDFSDGTYYWNVSCNDTLGNTNTSATRSLTVDTKGPQWVMDATNVSSLTPQSGSVFFMEINWTDVTTKVHTAILYYDDTIANSTTSVTEGGVTNISYYIPLTENGTKQVYMWANDTVGNANYTYTINITVNDALASQIVLNAPINAKNFSTKYNNSIQFNFTATDASGISTCNLSIDGTVQRTITGITSGTLKTTYATSNFSDGVHSWNISCNDTLGNTNVSESRSFTVDTHAPSYDTTDYGRQNVSTYAPNTADIIYFVTNWTDATMNVSTVKLFFNGSAVNTTTTVTNNNLLNLSYTIPRTYNGLATVYMWANDTVGNSNTTTAINVTVSDNIAPQVVLSSPASNGANYSVTTATFTFSVSDNIDSTVNCSFYINQTTPVLNQTFNLTTGNTTIITGLAEATYQYTLNCSDKAGNTNNTIKGYTLVVDLTEPTGTTNITTLANVSGNVNLGWAADADATSYGIFRHTSNFSTLLESYRLANVSGTAWTDNTTSSGTNYWYAITLIDAAGNENMSQWSNSSTAKNITPVDIAAPKIPTSIKVTNASNTATIGWTKVFKDINNNADYTGLRYKIWYKASTFNLSKNSSAQMTLIGTETHPTNTTTWSIPSSCTSPCRYYIAVTTLDDGDHANETIVSAGNLANITLAYTAASSDDDDSSSSSSSGGGVPTTTSTNVNEKISRFWSVIEAGTTEEMNIDNDEIAIVQLKITAKDKAESVDIDVASLLMLL